MDKPRNPLMVKVHLGMSKCNQFGKGMDVYVGRTNSLRSLVVAVVSYMAGCGQQPGPFFRRQSGRPLIKPQFVTEVRKALTEAGLDQIEFACHSFPIGAATAAAEAGIFDSTIQTLGGWSSAAFLAYIRTPHQKLALLPNSVM